MNPTLPSVLSLFHWSDKEGGTENLRSYVVAEAVYDATVVFCNRFIEKSSRTQVGKRSQPGRIGVGTTR